MKPALLLLFNHRITQAQSNDARSSLGVERIVEPPPEISRIWAEVPPEVDDLTPHLAPVFSWLRSVASPGDYILIQGEFGATWLAVHQAFRLALKPIYSTTRRQALEEHLPDGSVQIRHTFAHVRFRAYLRCPPLTTTISPNIAISS